MKYPFVIATLFLTAPAWAGEAVQLAPDPDPSDPQKTYVVCLELAAARPEAGIEMAGKWRGLGGGEPADHCAAVALIGLKDYFEAAKRLEDLATSSKQSAGLRAGML